METYAGELNTGVIVRVLIHFSFCVLNLMLPSCRPHLAEVALRRIRLSGSGLVTVSTALPSVSNFYHLDGFSCQISGLKLFTTTTTTIIVFLIVAVTGATALSVPFPL